MPIDLHTVLLAVAVVAVLLAARRIFGRSRRTVRPPVALAPPSPAAAPTSGWRGLAARWAIAEETSAPLTRHATIAVGAVRWKNCVVVGVAPGGLRLAVRVPILGRMGTRPLEIPWSVFPAPEPARLRGAAALIFRLGDPPIALTLPTALWEKIRAARGETPPRS